MCAFCVRDESIFLYRCIMILSTIFHDDIYMEISFQNQINLISMKNVATKFFIPLADSTFLKAQNQSTQQLLG